MRRNGFLAVAAVSALLFAASTASATTWTKDSAKCRASLSKNAGKVVKAVEKGIGGCMKNDLKAGGNGAGCYLPANYDVKGKVGKAVTKLVGGALKCKNDGVQMLAEYGGVCPSPGTPATLTTLTDLHNCIANLAVDLTVQSYQDLLRNPAAGPVSKTGQKCSGTLFKGIGKYVDTSLKSTGKCQASKEKGDVKLSQNTAGYQCAGDDTKSKVSGALTKFFAALPGGTKPKCSVADLAELGVAGQDATSTDAANFERRVATTGALALLPQAPIGLARSLAEGLGQQVWEGGQCPVSTQIRIVSKFDGKGSTNLDTGFTGAGHNFDLPSNFLGHVTLDFSGDPTCSAGAISISPFFEGNRCANDNTQTCGLPNQLDTVSCSGALCQPHFGPPLALNSANTPVCIDNVIGSVTGTANAGTGESTSTTSQRSVVSTGITQTHPCATCDGDTTANDGSRDGVCSDGPDGGNPCDANSGAGTFGPTSYDCTGGGVNVSGAGLNIALNLTTGTDTLSDTATTGAAACGPGNVLDCQCAVCSGDSTVPCNTDADCAAVSAGTCSSDGSGVARLPNSCVADGFVCTDTGDGIHGECASTVDNFCDGVTHPDGSGYLACDTDADCNALNAECGGSCGTCSQSRNRACFLPDIVVSGHPSQDTTTVAGNFCVAGLGSSGSSINTAAGLAGPARIAIDFELNPFCDSPPTKSFVGNGGNCNRP